MLMCRSFRFRCGSLADNLSLGESSVRCVRTDMSVVHHAREQDWTKVRRRPDLGPVLAQLSLVAP